jgi:hypothetical protein
LPFQPSIAAINVPHPTDGAVALAEAMKAAAMAIAMSSFFNSIVPSFRHRQMVTWHEPRLLPAAKELRCDARVSLPNLIERNRNSCGKPVSNRLIVLPVNIMPQMVDLLRYQLVMPKFGKVWQNGLPNPIRGPCAPA